MSEVKQRLMCERTINHNLFRLKFGTVNKSNPQVVYLDGRTFISPLFDSDSYSQQINVIRRNFSTSISRELSKSKLFDTKFILDFQVANSGVRVGKKSFLSFQLMLKQKSGNILPFKEIKEACESTLLSLIDNMVDSISDDFLVSKTKKETIYIKIES